MLKLTLIIFILSGFTLSAHAQLRVEDPYSDGYKDTGGGCIIGNTLCDLAEGKTRSPLSHKVVLQSLTRVLKNRMNDLPELEVWLKKTIEGKDWYLESDDLSENCRSQLINLMPEKQRIVGCQSALEVRIEKKFFTSASQFLVDQLIVHEAILAATYKNNVGNANLAREITRSLLNEDIPSVKARHQLRKLGMPLFYLRREQQQIVDLTEKICINQLGNREQEYLDALTTLTMWNIDLFVGLHPQLTNILNVIENDPAYSKFSCEDIRIVSSGLFSYFWDQAWNQKIN